MSIRMLLSSEDSSEYFQNNPNNFTTQLNKQIQFDGYWTVALTEFNAESWLSTSKIHEIFVCCNICEETIVGSKEMPLLRRIYLEQKTTGNMIFTLPYYIPVKIAQIQQISLYIMDRDGKLVSFLNGAVNISLHFKKFRYIL